MASLKRHGISIIRELSSMPRVQVDKHKVLQILVNLISNAKHALDVLPESQRVLRVRLFSHGFTTRTDGHGFGLHSSVLTRAELQTNLIGRFPRP